MKFSQVLFDLVWEGWHAFTTNRSKSLITHHSVSLSPLGIRGKIATDRAIRAKGHR